MMRIMIEKQRQKQIKTRTLLMRSTMSSIASNSFGASVNSKSLPNGTRMCSLRYHLHHRAETGVFDTACIFAAPAEITRQEGDRQRKRQTATDRDRQRQTETDRDRQRQTETHAHTPHHPNTGVKTYPARFAHSFAKLFACSAGVVPTTLGVLNKGNTHTQHTTHMHIRTET